MATMLNISPKSGVCQAARGRRAVAIINQILILFFRELKMLLLPLWLIHSAPDHKHFSHRRLTVHYRRRIKLVKAVWLGVAAILLVLPSPAFAVPLCLFSSFLSFSILDEHQ
jgi:hypothetical protein